MFLFKSAVVEVFFLLYFLFCVFAYEGDTVLKDSGEKMYNVIKVKTAVSQHGACWHGALRKMKGSCKNLNDREHSILALMLANCFLEDSGHITYDCYMKQTEDERRECISSMTDRAFTVYNEFYTHATNICFFLNHELWRAETENTIKQLYQATSVMKEQLIEASQIQNSMLESQKEGLRLQNELLDHGKELGSVIKDSSQTVSDMVVDFKESTKGQKELLYQIFSYLRTFQTWVIDEVSWFQSIIYYTVSCILCALFSSSKKTADARFLLFTILSLNVVIERMLVQYYNNLKTTVIDNEFQLTEITWMFRKGALCLCFVMLLYTYCFYKDEQIENCKTLHRIECQLNSLYEVSHQPIRYSKRLALKRLKTIQQDL
ncbi:uncharacterized protein LOC105699653 [Orussus abietinus]|uniref:uncharacterized protein LOC105699653 n=1 Tax=Orussus abietinus TaxID=222816 RepID=UPI00062638E1|nr:uncharacterized protein LOC105699653 [Orussus abietinus]